MLLIPCMIRIYFFYELALATSAKCSSIKPLRVHDLLRPFISELTMVNTL